MNREVHVRFWEGLAVRFHWATQLHKLVGSVTGLDIFWPSDESLEASGNLPIRTCLPRESSKISKPPRTILRNRRGSTC